jgi:hypothetical protein
VQLLHAGEQLQLLVVQAGITLIAGMTRGWGPYYYRPFLYLSFCALINTARFCLSIQNSVSLVIDAKALESFILSVV